MRAKRVNEKKEIHDPYILYMAFEISKAVELVYSADSEGESKEAIGRLKDIIKETVKVGFLYPDKEAEEGDSLELFSDKNWLLHAIPDFEIIELFSNLEAAGFIHGGVSPDSEEVNEGRKDEGDYSEALEKMDKFMPEDFELQREYYQIVDSEDVDKLVEFLETYADDRVYRYLPRRGTIRGFAEYIIEKDTGIAKSIKSLGLR